ncbi:ion transporter [Spartinivicinus ruber]|uniref:ion transporter n=1 Tax=Spartinivicinus ruber TaxID=2683272 RepID=UPI001CA3DB28|nr:ion transporter [Spartinivicinus ruber]
MDSMQALKLSNKDELIKLADYLIYAFIILSVFTFSIETLPDLSASSRKLLRYLEIVTVIVFTIEYVLRIFFADRKLKYIFSFYGLIDLLAILPFYIATSLDLRALRIVRLFRLLRVLKIIRYSQAIRRYHRALIIAKAELVLFGFTAIILLYLAAVGIYYFESVAQPEQFQSIFHSLWWAVATLTTVGYGDVYPITLGGRLFTFVILTIGLGFVAVPTGLLASALSQARNEEDQ